MPSQQKWVCATPAMLGQFPAAALAFRRGEPVVEEHRSLAAAWAGRTPIIAESAAFDPNRDAGDIAPAPAVKTGEVELAQGLFTFPDGAMYVIVD